MTKMIYTAVNGTCLAIQFLTTLPLKKQVQWNECNAKASLAAFPFIGLLLGMILAIISYLLQNHIPNAMFVFLLFFLSVLYSGGLHIDGYMDVSDAVLSYRDREKKLAIMKDPQVGPFAVLSLIFLIGWRLLFMYEVLKFSTYFSLYVLFIPFLTRHLMGWMLLYGEPAKNEGLAHMYKPYRSTQMKIIYVVWLMLATIFSYVFLQDFFIAWCVLILAAFLFSYICLKFYNRQFGGITGDTIGATGEGGETFLWMIAFLLHYFGTV